MLKLPRRARNKLPRCFDPEWYVQAYPDIAAAGICPARHYLRHGMKEGRHPCFDPISYLERDLRWGLLTAKTLEQHFQNSPDPKNRLTAAIAMARFEVRRGEWRKASEWLSKDIVERNLIPGFHQTDPALLAIECALVCGQVEKARRVLDSAKLHFGATPDILLAQANLASKDAGFPKNWSDCLSKLYARSRLTVPRLRGGDTDTALFDCLWAKPKRHIQNGPLVSIVMPAKNAEATISTALSSLCNQSWRNIEIIVVENGSSDKTTSVLRIERQRDPRIRVIDGSSEPGTYAARNLGAQAARGEFITVLDADDWAHPDRIARQVRTLRRRAPPRACLTDWVRMTADLRFTRWWGEDGLIHPDLSSLMIRADLAEKLGYWDRVKVGADTEYVDRIKAVFGPGSVSQVHPGVPLGFGRHHDKSLTRNPETHISTHRNGIRRSYRMASRRWHQHLINTRLDPNVGLSHARPFPAPPRICAPQDANPDQPDLVASGLYDDAWYVHTYPDLREGDEDGLGQFQKTGLKQGRSPEPQFSPSGYSLANNVGLSSAIPHYLSVGKSTGLKPLPVFSGALPPPSPGTHLMIFGHRAGKDVLGAERCLPHLLDQARLEGKTPSVVLPHILNKAYLSLLREKSHAVHIIPYGQRFGGTAPHPATVDQIKELLIRGQVSEVHQNTLVLDTPLVAARAVGIRSVVHVHELPQTDLSLCSELGVRAEQLRADLLSQADRFVANSAAVVRWLNVPEPRIVLNPPQIDAGLAALPFAPPETLRVALIGGISMRKGAADAVEVAKICHKLRLKAVFHLVGPADKNCRALKLPQNCHFKGPVPTPTEAMKNADIVLSLSKFAESFGLTVAEALAAGRPVICYDRGTPPDLVGSTGAGRIVPADHPELVAQQVIDWARNRKKLMQASQEARKLGRTFPNNRKSGPIFGAA